jgi:hypothetical protein
MPDLVEEVPAGAVPAQVARCVVGEVAVLMATVRLDGGSRTDERLGDQDGDLDLLAATFC